MIFVSTSTNNKYYAEHTLILYLAEEKTPAIPIKFLQTKSPDKT